MFASITYEPVQSLKYLRRILAFLRIFVSDFSRFSNVLNNKIVYKNTYLFVYLLERNQELLIAYQTDIVYNNLIKKLVCHPFIKTKFLNFYLRYKWVDINLKFINNKNSGVSIRQIHFANKSFEYKD